MRKQIALALGLACAPMAAQADSVIKCGGSFGYSYYMEGGIVAADGAGWSEDQISKGQIIFLMKGKKPQLLVGDAVGTRDIESDGAQLLVTQANGTTIVVLAVYPLAVETYAFRIGAQGKGEVIWSGIKTTGAMDKGSLMRAACELTG
jgi:hypothetical protein